MVRLRSRIACLGIWSLHAAVLHLGSQKPTDESFKVEADILASA